MVELAVLAIFKREGLRLAEWLAWHRMVGVDFFLLYDNDDTPDLASYAAIAPLAAAGMAQVIRMPGKKKQTDAYWNGRDRFNATRQARWVAVIDCDEFLEPRLPFRTVPEALEGFDRPDIAGVVASWANFGSSGHDDPPPLATVAFTRRAVPDFNWNRLCKQIFRPGRVGSHVNPHEFPPNRGQRVVDCRGRNHSGAFVDPVCWERLRVAHYNTRSRVEYRDKLARGYADQDRPRDDAWDILDRNEEADTSLADRFPELEPWLRDPVRGPAKPMR